MPMTTPLETFNGAVNAVNSGRASDLAEFLHDQVELHKIDNPDVKRGKEDVVTHFTTLFNEVEVNFATGTPQSFVSGATAKVSGLGTWMETPKPSSSATSSTRTIQYIFTLEKVGSAWKLRTLQGARVH